MHYRMDHSRGLAVEGYTIFDLPDAFHQVKAGLGLGVEQVVGLNLYVKE